MQKKTFLEPWGNFQTIFGDVLNQFSIFCNSSAYGSNSSVTWIKSPNKINISVLQPDSRILITNNGQLVNFTTLYPLDEQYYACGVILNNKLQIVNQYYLFVRGKKSLLFGYLQSLAKNFS